MLSGNFLNFVQQFFDEESPRYKAAALKALQAAKANDCLLEVNTGGVYRGYRKDFYPGKLPSEVQQAYNDLISYCGGVEDVLQKSEEFRFYPECHRIMDVARYRLEHNIEFSALSEKGKKYFNS